jgi:hypothetical protein
LDGILELNQQVSVDKAEEYETKREEIALELEKGPEEMV